MGYTLAQFERQAGNSIPDASTRYINHSGHRHNSTTETSNELTMRTAGTFDQAACYVTSNTVSLASTFRSRINNANGNIAASITGNTTGLFEDTTNSDAVVSGDIFDYAVDVPSVAGNQSINVRQGFARFLASSNTSQRSCAAAPSGTPDRDFTASATRYLNVGGQIETTETTEANTQFKFYSVGTLKNLFIMIGTNNRTDTVTFRSRVGAANGGLTISILTLETGVFEDTSGSDSIVSGNLVNLSIGGTGTGTLSINFLGVDFETTNGKSHYYSHHLPVAFTAGISFYFPMQGGLITTSYTSEVPVQYKARFACKITNMQIYLSANAATGNGTFDSRIGEASGGVSVSVTASTTGLFEDTTGSDTIAIGDLINYRFLVGSGGTSTVTIFGCMVEDTTPSPSVAAPSVTGAMRRRMLMGVGL